MRALHFVIGSLLVLASACSRPAPTLATMISPVITAQRVKGGALQVQLTWDTGKTACGEVTGLTATLDDVDVHTGIGSYNDAAQDDALKCTFPAFLATVPTSTTSRTIVFKDGTSQLTMTVDTLELGAASPRFFPPQVAGGEMLAWDITMPAQGTTEWKASFIADSGAETTWLSGTTLTDPRVTATVTAVTNPVGGKASFTWMINGTITRCEGASCNLTLQGYSGTDIVVTP